MTTRPAARVGDAHACPEMKDERTTHVGGPVTEGSPDTFINGVPAARVGDPTLCDGPPGEIGSGSSGVLINRQAVARVADDAGHGGRMVRGSENVHIGDHGGRSSGRSGPGQQATGTLAVVLHANYDRRGGLSADTNEHGHRLLRPGAILLADLDIEQLPSGVATAATPAQRSRVPHVDAFQAILPPSDEEVANCKLDRSHYDPISATQAELVLHPADSNRIRLFTTSGGLPIAGVEGPLSGPRDASSTEHRYRIPEAELPIDLYALAVALPGDPARPGARGLAPHPPSAEFHGTRPSLRSGRMYGQRAPGEVWIEIVHRGGGQVKRDVSLFTIAPFLLVPNTQPVEVLYIVYSGAGAEGSHPTVWDISYECRQIFGASSVDIPSSSNTADPVGSLPFIAHTPPTSGSPSAANKTVHLLGSTDRWIQDQILMGYCRAPHRTISVVAHCKRTNPLQQRVREDFATDGVGLYEGLSGAERSGQDYGGNIEVSPPVSRGTAAMPRNAAGPTVPDHPAAPLGKIIFGDCTPVPAHRETRRFLLAQRVQPVLPLDTSWLRVGHVDEFMTTVPDGRGGFKLLMASATAMTMLLERTAQVTPDQRTGFHRGRYQDGVYAELDVDDLLNTPVNNYAHPGLLRVGSGRPPRVTVKEYNDALDAGKLTPIAARLREGLALATGDVLPLPMYFSVPSAHTSAQIRARHPGHLTSSVTAALVNLVVLGSHLLVPRPQGPRVSVRDAIEILQDVLAGLGLGDRGILFGSTETIHWSPPDEENWKVYAYFARFSPADRRLFVEIMRRNDPTAMANLSPAGLAALATSRDSIRAKNLDASFAPDAWSASWPAWRRVLIDEGTVDIVEAYVHTLISPLGLTPHFVDDWSYHTRVGSVHCGTNVRRTPPNVSWWDPSHYDPVGAHWRYDPSG
jgi:uncharacterized Zn-binding protein involved in type VI secretion